MTNEWRGSANLSHGWAGTGNCPWWGSAATQRRNSRAWQVETHLWFVVSDRANRRRRSADTTPTAAPALRPTVAATTAAAAVTAATAIAVLAVETAATGKSGPAAAAKSATTSTAANRTAARRRPTRSPSTRSATRFGAAHRLRCELPCRAACSLFRVFPTHRHVDIWWYVVMMRCSVWTTLPELPPQRRL